MSIEKAMNFQLIASRLRFEWVLISLAIASILLSATFSGTRIQHLKPSVIYSYDQSISFQPSQNEVSVFTYLPQNNGRQVVIQESIDAANMEFNSSYSSAGKVGHWIGDKHANRIQYKALINTRPVEFTIDPDTTIETLNDESLLEYLSETDSIAVNHPEIAALWQSIKPTNSNNVIEALRAIYNYTSGLETLPFKGTTSSLTALRLGAASCNGKSRLFVSLARHIGLPARLVGGVVLNQDKKRTSHQWIEVQLLGHWVPFDATNQYFAELPGHYLELYRGDNSLFRHTSNIQFDYLFNNGEKKIAPAFFLQPGSDNAPIVNLAALFTPLKLSPQTVAIFLLFPLCALIVTFLRNVVGVQTFGVFVPMLIAITCTYTGLVMGLMGVVITVLVAFGALILFEKARVLKVPRLGATITIITLFVLTLFYFSDFKHPLNVGFFALFPIVIISFVAEKLLALSSERDWHGLLVRVVGSGFTIALCYFFIESVYLRSLFALYPEALVIVLALQIYIGRWNGIRLSELFRFRDLLKKGEPVIGINERNREVVYRFNEPEGLVVAADKLVTKKILSKAGIPVPDTLLSCASHAEVIKLDNFFDSHNQFVIKPNTGSQGNGIIVIKAKQGQEFITASGSVKTRSQLKAHVSDIISGSFSQHGESDIAYLEPLIVQHEVLQDIAPSGLSDIRLILVNKTVIAAMLRLPTESSHGKANLHQGAVGVAVDLESGKLRKASWKGKSLSAHPDTRAEFCDLQIPFWHEIIKIGEACSKVMPLGYLGVDVCLDDENGPLVLEVNGRPGLEIQNIQGKSFDRRILYQSVESV